MKKQELSELLLKIQGELRRKFPSLRDLELHYTDNEGIRHDDISIRAFKNNLLYGGSLGSRGIIEKMKIITEFDEGFVREEVERLVKLIEFKELNNEKE